MEAGSYWSLTWSSSIISISTIILVIKRIQTHRFAWDRHVLRLAQDSPFSHVATLGANGTLFDEFDLACLHSFTRDANWTFNMHKWHPTRVNSNVKCRVQYHGGGGAGKTENIWPSLCQNQMNTRNFHLFVCEIQAICLEVCLRWPHNFCKEILIELLLAFIGVRGV